MFSISFQVQLHRKTIRQHRNRQSERESLNLKKLNKQKTNSLQKSKYPNLTQIYHSSFRTDLKFEVLNFDFEAF